MTNKEAKQEAIKKAYGANWDLVQNLTPKNGNDYFDLIENGVFKIWFLNLTNGSYLDLFPFDKYHYCGSDIGNGYVMPLSIQGLHGNNGWIRIEADGSNLPKDFHVYSVVLNGKVFKDDCYFLDGVFRHVCENEWIKLSVYAGKVTHYKPINKELLPIY